MRRSRERREMQPWHVWRRRFWTRPGFFLPYAVLCVALAAGAVFAVVQTAHEVRIIESRHLCETEVSDRCLVREQGSLVAPGPQYIVRRNRGPYLLFEQGGQIVDSFDVTSSDYSRLVAGARDVSVLMLGDRVVVVEQPGGDVTAVTDSRRAVWYFGFVGLALLGMAFAMLRQARARRRTASGWWALDSRGRGEADFVAFGAFMVPLLVAVQLMFGVTWTLALWIVVPALAYAGWALVRDRARPPLEPDLPGRSRRR